MAGDGGSYTSYTMACIYKRHNSPFWWIKYKDAGGKTRRESTGYRYAVPAQTKKARILRSEKHVLELKREKGSEHGAWSVWVEKYLDRQYETQPKTLRRYKTCWRHLSAYLDSKQIPISPKVKGGHNLLKGCPVVLKTVRRAFKVKCVNFPVPKAVELSRYNGQLPCGLLDIVADDQKDC